MCAKIENVTTQEIMSKKMLNQHMSDYPPLYRHKHLNVSRFCTVSVLVSSLHAYFPPLADILLLWLDSSN